MRTDISIIIPAFNEEGAIENTVIRIDEQFRQKGVAYEIIVVDDGSTDATSRKLKEISLANLKVITHEKNRGYGAAIKSGIEFSASEILAITDADGTYPNEKISDLIFEIDQYDMVVGARCGQHVKIPLARRPAKWIIKKLAEYLCNKEIPDINSGLRVMRKSIVRRFLKLLPNGFSLTTTITLAMLTNEYRVKYVPIDYHRRAGRSKLRPIHDTLNFIQLIIRTVMYFDPLKVFLPASVFFFMISLLLVLHRVIVGKGFLVVSILLFVTAIQLLAIGALADLIDKRDSLR